MKKITPLIFLLAVFAFNTSWADDLVMITSDDIILKEPEFTNFVKQRMPSLMKKIENLAKEIEPLHLNVDFKSFEQFWDSVKSYYSLRDELDTNIQEYEEETQQIREQIFKQKSLKSTSAIKLILDYKFLKKNIDSSNMSIETLDSDLVLLFEVLKNKPVKTEVKKAKDLRTYAAVMANSMYDLTNKKIKLKKFKKISETNFEPVKKDKNAGHLQDQFMKVATEYTGEVQLSKKIKVFFIGLGEMGGKVYNFELYVMENKRVTIAKLVNMLITIAVVLIIYHLIIKIIYSRFVVEKSKEYAVHMLTKYVMYLAIVPIILAGIGLDLTKITLLISALSVGIGFGLTTIVSNFISGIILLLEGSIRIGDTLELHDGTIVRVELIGLRKSVLHRWDGLDIVVPNTELVTKNITNITYMKDPITLKRIKFSIAPIEDIEKLEKVAIESAIKTLGGRENIIKDAPSLRFTGFKAYMLECELRIFMDYQKENIPPPVFLRNLLLDFKEAGIRVFNESLIAQDMAKS